MNTRSELDPRSVADGAEGAGDGMDRDEVILAEVRTGRGVSHQAVRRWLLAKDSPSPLPRPEPGD